MPARPTIYLSVCNHFDPIWRRCFDRKVIYNGYTFPSYADLEAWYIDENLALARQDPDYTFEVEGVVVIRHYMRQHPQKLAELKKLAAAGHLGIRGTGDNIIDSNMVLGESIIRNYLTGILWTEDTFGIKTTVTARNDAFGNSAQLPQIFRGCGMSWVTGIHYTPAQGDYWRGLDGSTVATPTIPTVMNWATCGNNYPCPNCKGTGCQQCKDRGLVDEHETIFSLDINKETLAKQGWGLINIGSEEGLPSPHILESAKKLAQDYDVRFVALRELEPLLQGILAQVDSPPAESIHPNVELNPNNCGCWVTRIHTKQEVRRLEYALLGAETVATMAAISGVPYPRLQLNEAWQPTLFAMFHDAVTGTLTDSAYEELQDIWADADRRINKIRKNTLAALTTATTNIISIINPLPDIQSQLVHITLQHNKVPALLSADGKVISPVTVNKCGNGEYAVAFVAPHVPSFGASEYTIVDAPAVETQTLAEPIIENERFRVTGDQHGLQEIYDKELQKVISSAGEYRPGELILENDFGSPWTTLSCDRTRSRLDRQQQLVSAEAGNGWQRLVYQYGSDWNVGGRTRGVQVTTTITLYHGIARVDFRNELNWETYNMRLRVAMPVPMHGKHIYGIPYGALERAPYTLEKYGAWDAATGDWPAVNWAGVETSDFSVALLNRGLPSYKVEPGENGDTMFISLLRSPAIPTYLYALQTKGPFNFDGMRDEGHHVLEYALTAYAETLHESAVVADAEGYNAGLITTTGEVKLPVMPTITSENVRISAIKWAEAEDALILRLWEFRGRAGEATLTIPAEFHTVSSVNMLEREGTDIPISADGTITISLHMWEIATLRLAR
ncbi:MAG: glycoside hydrolase family 38 C-terminal domain-containing protein [bacterium]